MVIDPQATANSPAPIPLPDATRLSEQGIDSLWSLPQTGPQRPVSFPYPDMAMRVSPTFHSANLPPETNLGFVTLDDWFGTGPEEGEDINGGLGDLDLQDFWMKVGPGEVRLVTRNADKIGSRGFSISMIIYFLGLSPNILVPTRTLLLPSLIACRKSALIPMLSSNPLGAP